MHKSVALLVITWSLFVAVPRGFAQDAHAAPQSAIDAALEQHAAASDADREAVRQLLQREEVKAVAGQAGLDLRKANDAVATMSAADLAEVAARAQQVDRALAGGQSRVTLNTTYLIIGLLLLIVLIVALK